MIEDTSYDQWGGAAAIFLSDVKKTFESPGDEFSCQSDGKCRKRTLHYVGVVAKIKWLAQNTDTNPFTGLFKGAENGIIRFSTGAEPGANSMVPGIGIKLLRDGVDSGNLVAMPGLDP